MIKDWEIQRWFQIIILGEIIWFHNLIDWESCQTELTRDKYMSSHKFFSLSHGIFKWIVCVCVCLTHKLLHVATRSWCWVSSSITLCFVFLSQDLLLHPELGNSSRPVEQQIPRIPCLPLPSARITGLLPHLTLYAGAGIWSQMLTEGRVTENRSTFPLYKADALSLVSLPCQLFPQKHWGDQESDKI